MPVVETELERVRASDERERVDQIDLPRGLRRARSRADPRDPSGNRTAAWLRAGVLPGANIDATVGGFAPYASSSMTAAVPVERLQLTLSR